MDWRPKVLQAYNFKCFVTGLPLGGPQPLEAHHLYSKHTYPQHALDVRNGVLLSKEIHTKFHLLYSRKANTSAQFESWIEKTYPYRFSKNETRYPWREDLFFKRCEYIEKKFLTSPEFFKNRLLLLVEYRDHCLIRFDNESNSYVNKNTYIIIGCKKHDGIITNNEQTSKEKLYPQAELKTVGQYTYKKIGLKCCV